MSPTRLLALWRRLGSTAAGRWLFTRLVGRAAPYSGSIGATILALAPGRATVALRDRRAVRNHFGSVHAIALANLGELASGLAMTAALAPGTRGIPVELRIRYHRKARGWLTATGTASPGEVYAPLDAVAHADIHDTNHILVADMDVTWKLAPDRDR